MIRVFPVVLLLAGCPDPERGGAELPDAPMAGTTAPGGSIPGVGTLPTVTLGEGEGVRISGTFTYGGNAHGKLRVDFSRPGADGRPEVLHALSLEKQGDWSVTLPAGLGKVDVLAFVDATGNGPNATEPSASVKGLEIGDVPIDGLALTLVDGAPNDLAVEKTPPPIGDPARVTPVVPPDPGKSTSL